MTDRLTFETLKFNNLALETLPIDTITENYVRPVKKACFSKISPTPCDNPRMVVFSRKAMELVDLDKNELERKEAPEYLSGNKLMPGSDTAAHCYCGHQFGHFAGQLGDGAAIYLGEVLNKKGERWELQLKGAGRTPYSRTADGRKVFRSTLREFLGSEAMHFLNVATTRAGSCIVSDTQVVRDMHYDGNPKLENCAVVLRISQTFIRFGSFEAFLPSRGSEYSDPHISKTLLDYVCDSFFPETKNCEEPVKYERFIEAVARKTAKLVSDWQCCGFVHGVLNTDNMSILGLTIDYGPYGFLDRHDPNYIFNGSDTAGRYTYANQPDICEWNLNKLADALEPIIDLNKSKSIIKETYKREYKRFYLEGMRKKLGLFAEMEEDKKLVESFLATLFETGTDFTNSFRNLSRLQLNGRDEIESDIKEFLKIISKQFCPVEEMKNRIMPKFKPETLEKLLQAMQENPIILSYYGLSEEFIRTEVANLEKFQKVEDWTEDDKQQVDLKAWTKWLNTYLDRLYKECEQFDVNQMKKRVDLMNSVNPRFVLRNHLAQEAIESFEKRQDNTEAKMLLKLLENPFSDSSLEEILNEFSSETEKNLIASRKESMFYEKPPQMSKCTKLSCSS